MIIYTVQVSGYESDSVDSVWKSLKPAVKRCKLVERILAMDKLAMNLFRKLTYEDMINPKHPVNKLLKKIGKLEDDARLGCFLDGTEAYIKEWKLR